MPKKKVPTVALREEQYFEKALKWRTGGGLVPPYLAEASKAVVQKMHSSWRATFGRFSQVWWSIVVPILEAHDVPKIEHNKYKAFVNRYISKCLIKRSERPDAVKEDFVEIHRCDPAILDEITAKIGELL